MKRILVTGASGFIGANLTRTLLKKDYQVYAFIRPNSHNIWRLQDIIKELRIYQVDLCDRENVARVIKKIKPEIIFHLAAYGTYPNEDNFKKIINVNLMGTINLVETLMRAGFESFINAGSSSEYGPKNRAMMETDKLEPITLYGVAKASSSIYLSQIAKSKNLPVLTLRLFSVYGPYEESRRLIPTLMMAVFNNKVAKLAQTNSVRDFIFVEDVVNIFLNCARNRISGVFNVGSGREIKIKKVVQIVSKISNRNLHVKWGQIQPRPYELAHWVADIKLSQKVLKWKPKYSLEVGLEKTYRWFRKYRHYYL